MNSNHFFQIVRFLISLAGAMLAIASIIALIHILGLLLMTAI